jgi:hypothetical protein
MTIEPRIQLRCGHDGADGPGEAGAELGARVGAYVGAYVWV